MVAKYYFNAIYDEGKFDDYMDRGVSPQIRQAQEMTHPTLEIAVILEKNREEGTYLNYARRKNVWFLNEYYDPLNDCKRSNCSFCLEHDITNPVLVSAREGAKQIAINRLKMMRDFLEVSMMNTELLMMNTIIEEEEEEAILHTS